MESIICPLTYIPIRFEPSHRSEQVSQLLFGETAKILEENKEWLHVKTSYDSYEGWIESKVILENNASSLKSVAKGPLWVYNVRFGTVFVSVGSEIPYPDKENHFLLGRNVFVLDDNFTILVDSLSFYEVVESFVGTPYLWGGRSLYGIDCSGLSQIIYKIFNIVLPRDASQQVAMGTTIPFISQVNPGDLAFFDNDEGKITHVGLILSKGKIIHASGSVKIDMIDQQGIYNHELKKYTHRLRIIKRIADTNVFI